jgi:hypothetical protein
MMLRWRGWNPNGEGTAGLARSGLTSAPTNAFNGSVWRGSRPRSADGTEGNQGTALRAVPEGFGLDTDCAQGVVRS